MTTHWIAETGAANAAEIAGKATLTAESSATGTTPRPASATTARQDVELSLSLPGRGVGRGWGEAARSPSPLPSPPLGERQSRFSGAAEAGGRAGRGRARQPRRTSPTGSGG